MRDVSVSGTRHRPALASNSTTGTIRNANNYIGIATWRPDKNDTGFESMVFNQCGWKKQKKQKAFRLMDSIDSEKKERNSRLRLCVVRRYYGADWIRVLHQIPSLTVLSSIFNYSESSDVFNDMTAGLYNYLRCVPSLWKTFQSFPQTGVVSDLEWLEGRPSHGAS